MVIPPPNHAADIRQPLPLAEAASRWSTPLLLLDHHRLEENLRRMRRRAENAGVALRPHLKTAKSAHVARLAVSGLASDGIAVATVREAEYFAAHGFRDLFWAVTPTRPKLDRVARLIAAGVTVKISLDSLAVARASSDAARELGVKFPVMIEVECGDARCGIPPTAPELLELGHHVAGDPGLHLVGVYTHAGHSYDHICPEALGVVAREEGQAAVLAAEALRNAGIRVQEVSVGSTPTVSRGEPVPGVTEVRAGVYMFSDCFQAGLGSSGYEDIAISVLATVISNRPDQGHLVVDAGSLAMSKDRSTERLGGKGDVGFGRVCHHTSQEWIPDLRFTTVNQEHGIVKASSPEVLASFPVGSLLRIQPNHACVTAACFDAYHVVDGHRLVVDVWDRVNGW